MVPGEEGVCVGVYPVPRGVRSPDVCQDPSPRIGAPGPVTGTTSHESLRRVRTRGTPEHPTGRVGTETPTPTRHPVRVWAERNNTVLRPTQDPFPASRRSVSVGT